MDEKAGTWGKLGRSCQQHGSNVAYDVTLQHQRYGPGLERQLSRGSTTMGTMEHILRCQLANLCSDCFSSTLQLYTSIMIHYDPFNCIT